MKRFLRTLLIGRWKVFSSPRRASQSACPGLEQLEDRAVPNASPLAGAHAASPLCDASRDLRDVRGDLTKLTRDLRNSVTPTVRADISTLRADVNAIAADLKAGTDPSADVNKALNDGQTLFADLGPNLTKAVRKDVLDITADAADVVVDLASTPPSQGSLLTNAQNDLANLTQLLGSQASHAVAADLSALQADLTAIATAIQSGKGLNRDVRHALRDEARLFGDLNGQLSPSVTNTLVDMYYNLSQELKV